MKRGLVLLCLSALALASACSRQHAVGPDTSAPAPDNSMQSSAPPSTPSDTSTPPASSDSMSSTPNSTPDATGTSQPSTPPKQ